MKTPRYQANSNNNEVARLTGTTSLTRVPEFLLLVLLVSGQTLGFWKATTENSDWIRCCVESNRVCFQEEALEELRLRK